MYAHLDALHAELRTYALDLPAAEEHFPWDEPVIKVKGKIFVFLGRPGGEALTMSVKLPTSAAAALTLPEARPTGYGLGKAGWVSFTFPADRLPTRDTARAWILESWRAVAPRRLGKSLE